MNKSYLKTSAIYYISAILVCIFFVLGYKNIITNNVLSSVLIQTISMLFVPFALYTILVSKNPKQTLSDCGVKKVDLKTIGICVILGFLLYFFNAFISNFFGSLLTLFDWENIYGMFSNTKGVPFNYGMLLEDLILSCIFPAVCEEFLHRGIVLHAGKKHANPKFCLLLSSVLFGFMHLNIRQFFYATILGYIIGLVTLACNSIIPGMILHFMNNALSSFFYYGSILGWKIPTIYNNLLKVLRSNILIYTMVMLVVMLFIVYSSLFLIIKLKKMQAQKQVKEIVKNLDIEGLPIEIVQAKIDEANSILALTQPKTEHKKLKFCNHIFNLSTFMLTGILTICTFIWGII